MSRQDVVNNVNNVNIAALFYTYKHNHQLTYLTQFGIDLTAQNVESEFYFVGGQNLEPLPSKKKNNICPPASTVKMEINRSRTR